MRGCYRFRAEGHNTIIFNPAPNNDQVHVADCAVNRFAAEGDSFAIGDMSTAFNGQKVLRGMKMLRESGSVILQDEIECAAEDVIRWTAHTPASVIFRDKGKTAILDVDGKKMCAILLTDGYFTVRAAVSDENSPEVAPAPTSTCSTPKPQATNEGIQKLEIHLTGKESHRIAVLFYPLGEGREIPSEYPEIVPLENW